MSVLHSSVPQGAEERLRLSSPPSPLRGSLHQPERLPGAGSGAGRSQRTMAAKEDFYSKILPRRLRQNRRAPSNAAPAWTCCCPWASPDRGRSYVSMDMGALPPFWLAYLSDPSDSGRIHSNIRQRWLSTQSPRRGWGKRRERERRERDRRERLIEIMRDRRREMTRSWGRADVEERGEREREREENEMRRRRARSRERRDQERDERDRSDEHREMREARRAEKERGGEPEERGRERT
ncbi:hypothetical protein D4764_12G0000570 [Takifugu flavidus]|uniref:Uncharacterized protein n=1 Tax=Takifugu flavidus TaxID=433684 RepID=A0A5C6PEG0_9TELE|nr:hypothetical protein D4764_12G0000570 [Takifugu flavidus]